MPEFAFNLSWSQARALAVAGAYIRRWDWTDRWLMRTGFLWWIVPLIPGAFEPRLVQATDFGRMEFLATDYTTMWPDQRECLIVVEPPIEEPELPPVPPPPIPDPTPTPGGSVRRHYEFFTRPAKTLGVFGLRTEVNPLPAAVTVRVTGKADGALSLNGIIVAIPPDAFSPAIVDHTFFLGTGQTFTFGTRISGNGDTGYNLDFNFSF